MTGLDRCRHCDNPVGEGWTVCPFCETRLANSDDDDQDGQALVADGGEEIDELTVDDDATIDEFAEIAEEQTRGVDFLMDPDDAELTLVELSASHLDDDGHLRTFSVSADGFDADEYGKEPSPDADEEPPSDGDRRDLLRALFAESFRHPARWSEWRRTLLVFAIVEGVPKDALRQAHRQAAQLAGAEHSGEFTDAVAAAEEYLENRDQDDSDLVTDGGVEVQGAKMVAAERITGPDCEFGDCDADAGWLIEAEAEGATVGIICCQPCSESNRLYAHENELWRNDVSTDIRQTTDVDFEIAWPDPAEMSVADLREEYQNLAEDVWGSGVSHDPEHRRLEALWDELRDRTGVEQPQCPKCGARNWAQTPGDPKHCRSCDYHPTEVHMGLIEKIDEAWERILSPDAETDGGEDLNYRIRIDAPEDPIQFIKLVDMLGPDDKAIWNRRSDPVTVEEIALEEGSPDGAGRFKKQLLCENRERSNGARYRLTFEQGRDASETMAPVKDIPTTCFVQRHIGPEGNSNGWGPTADVEILANVTPIQSIERDEEDEPEIRTDGGVEEDLDEATDGDVAAATLAAEAGLNPADLKADGAAATFRGPGGFPGGER